MGVLSLPLSFEKTLIRGVSAAALLSAGTVPALAQLDEIVVTATKREQSLQDVPIAVTAYSAETLAVTGVTDIKQLRNIAPSLKISQSNSLTDGINFRIRGFGTTGNNPSLEGAVGVFLDGVYLSRQGIAFQDFLDIEQIELLRGPQGTLFGRNTTAGAINIRTKRPSVTEWDAQGAASFGNFGLRTVSVSAGGPIIQDRLGFRVSGSYEYHNDYYTNVSGAESGLASDNFAIRGQLGFEPTSDISIRLIGDYLEAKDTCCDSVWEHLPPGVIAAVGTVTGTPAQTFPDEAGQDRRIGQSNSGFRNPSDQWGISGELNWDTNVGTLTYIGSYRDWFGSQENADADFLAVDVSIIDIPVDVKTMTHELRLQGEKGPLDWLIGGFYSDEKIRRSFDLILGADTEAYQNAILAQVGAGTMDALVSGLTGGFITDYDGQYTNEQLYGTDSSSWSLFTHNIIQATDKLDITLGGRWIREDKDGFMFHGARTNSTTADIVGLAALAELGGAGAFITGVPGFATAAPALVLLGTTNCTPVVCNLSLGPVQISPEFQEEFTDEEWTGVISVGYNWTDTFRTYASFSHGFKAGGILLDGTAAAGGASPVFGSETVNNYEIGIRSEFFDGRVRANITGFFMDFKDLQVQEFTGINFVVFNVPEAESRGVEVELLANPIEGLSLNVGVTYADASYDDSAANRAVLSSGDIVALPGQQLTVAPLWSGSISGTYRRPVPNTSYESFIHLNWYAESATRTGTAPGASFFNSEAFKRQPGFGKLNARIGFGDQDGRWSVELWGENLTQKTTKTLSFNGTLSAFTPGAFPVAPFTHGSLGTQLDTPRIWGATLRARY